MDVGAVTPVPVGAARARVHQRLHRRALRRAAHVQLPSHRRRLLRHAERAGPTRCLKWVDHFEPIMDEWDRLITHNNIFMKRLANVAVITAEEAVDWGLVGPNLRASGVNWDLRKEDEYSVYAEHRLQGAGGERVLRYDGRLLGPVLAPRRGMSRKLQDPPAGVRADQAVAGGRHRRQAAEEDEARGRGLRARRERARRHGLLRHRCRQGGALSRAGSAPEASMRWASSNPRARACSWRTWWR